VTVGILNINKPVGWTSHDVVARVRRVAAERRVGHAGTLDPLASGVLPVLLGRATRLADFIQAQSKTYVATLALGAATSTDDAEGSVVATAPIPALDAAVLQPVLARFSGPISQIPPAYSAVKVAGQRAYAVARAGGTVALQPRPVTIYDLRVLATAPLQLEVTCSKGTYIRSLARDIAQALGTVGHLQSLVRTRVGPFALQDAVTLDGLDVTASLLPPDVALRDAPAVSPAPEGLQRLVNGQAVGVDGLHANPVRVYDPNGRLVCVAEADGQTIQPRIML
jgi:tRNA pseudouridine55 synthase